MKKLLIYALIIFGLTSCAYMQELENKKNQEVINAYNSWMGTHKSNLIKSWGPPTRYSTDGNGGDVLIYETYHRLGSVIGGTYIENLIINYREMYADKNGILYHWRQGSR